MASKRKGPTPEGRVKNAVFTWCHLHGFFVWDNKSTGLFDPTTKRFRALGKWAIRGTPDLVGILPDGRFLGIEIKVPKTQTTTKTYPTKEQKLFIGRSNELGALCFVARSIEDLEENLKPYLPVKHRENRL